ncbi:hypothetical protein BDV95DRAFT_592990 [Massariosphaeria phaeospora]|uniref:Putative gamma-glutamylcyclotransferase n=1 Tax=Massariosphaeria phaeospora TaxID=100035 RepID=A0A7C8MNN6_9PLEO|nr:hypothetical protein BDV95DRAFT_592990 [Massariosphaeria phaeospora]
MAKNAEPKLNPEDLRLYSLALNNRLSKKHLYSQLGPDAPVFVYCSLMLPWVLAKVLNVKEANQIEQATTYMTRATLQHHFRTSIKYAGLPTIVRTQKPAAVDGMLIFGLQPIAAAKIEEYIGLEQHSKRVMEVQIETNEGEEVTIAAHVYVWKGPLSALEPKSWTPMEYMRSGLLLVNEIAADYERRVGMLNARQLRDVRNIERAWASVDGAERHANTHLESAPHIPPTHAHDTPLYNPTSLRASIERSSQSRQPTAKPET